MQIKQQSLTPLDFGGLRILDYTAERDWDASIAVIEVPAGAGHAEAWSRRSDKYYLVTRGAIRFVVDGEVLELAAGDLCFVRRGRRFAYSNPGPAAAALVLVHTPSFQLGQEVFVEAGKGNDTWPG